MVPSGNSLPGSPTVASRETLGNIMLLSFGDEGAEEMGFIPFLLQLLPQKAQTHLVIFPF